MCRPTSPLLFIFVGNALLGIIFNVIYFAPSISFRPENPSQQYHHTMVSPMGSRRRTTPRKSVGRTYSATAVSRIECFRYPQHYGRTMARGFVGRHMQLLVLRKVADDGRFVHRRLLEVYANGFTSAGGRRISQRVVRAAITIQRLWRGGCYAYFVCVYYACYGIFSFQRNVRTTAVHLDFGE